MFFGRVGPKMLALPQHRTKTAHLPHQPGYCFRSAAAGLRKKPLKRFGQVEQDRPRLKDTDRTIRIASIDQRRNSAVGINRPIRIRKLLAFKYIHRLDDIRYAKLLKQNLRLMSVWCCPRVEFKHPRTLTIDPSCPNDQLFMHGRAAIILKEIARKYDTPSV